MFINDTFTCEWCDSNISSNCLLSVGSNPLRFCDYICAKIYNDKVNKIDIDYRSYNTLYVNNLLDTNSRKLFNIVKNSGFYMLPTIYRNVDISDVKNRRILCSEYKKYIYN